MNKKTLEYASEQLKQLRQPALMGRQYNEYESVQRNYIGTDAQEEKRGNVGERCGTSE